jgi:hypothetical protein
MISTTADLLVQTLDTISQQRCPQINLNRDTSLIVGTYYVCHAGEQIDEPLGVEDIAQHIFVTKGGCVPCLEHFYRTKDSFSKICQIA